MTMHEARVSAPALFTANTFRLEGPIQISYSSTSISGRPLVTYTDADGTLNFIGDEIARVQTDRAELVTVVVQEIVDAFVRTVTIVVPTVKLAQQGDSTEIETFVVETTDRSLSFVQAPGPVGQLQAYRLHQLRGTAEFVVS